MTQHGIVVGIDSSSAAAHAYRWSVARAELFGPVRPVAAWTNPWWYTLSAPMTAPDGPGPDIARACADLVDELSTRTDPSHLAEPVIAKGAAGPVLVDVATDASLLVVGTRGRGALTDSLLGSVSTYCASHASTPVAVVPEDSAAGPDGPVVVGMDGSAGADAALDWALATAADDQPIIAVQAWNIPVLTGYEGMAIDPEVVKGATLDAITRSVAEACDRAGVTSDRVKTRAVEGDARTVLRTYGERASMVVVGRRGHNRLAQVLLGSVAASLVHRPTTTVVVVPAS